MLNAVTEGILKTANGSLKPPTQSPERQSPLNQQRKTLNLETREGGRGKEDPNQQDEDGEAAVTRGSPVWERISNARIAGP